MAGASHFLFDGPQLGAGLSLLGLRISSGLNLPPLPVAADPAAALRGATGFDPQTEQLSAEATQIMRALANPSRALSVKANTAGSSAWTTSSLIEGDGAYVQLQSDSGQYDLALAHDVGEAAELIGLLDTPSVGGRGPGIQAKLPPLGYVALLAAADGSQRAELRSRLGRTREWRPVLSGDLLEAELESGLARPDTRWAVSAGMVVAPIDLASAAGQMGQGLIQLEQAGLTRLVSRGYGFSPAGQTLARDLSSLQATVGVSLMGGAGPALRQACLFGCASSFVLASWAAGADGNVVRLEQAGAAAAQALIREFLTRPAASQSPETVCANPACGRPLRAGVKFCPHCGLPTALPLSDSVCAKCGRARGAGKKFCTACGTPYAA